MEVDCPRCGIDYDASYDERRCPCGAIWSEELIAQSNHYDAAGNHVPFSQIT